MCGRKSAQTLAVLCRGESNATLGKPSFIRLTENLRDHNPFHERQPNAPSEMITVASASTERGESSSTSPSVRTSVVCDSILPSP